MSSFLSAYFDTEGPFGLPMKDRQAKALETVLHELPKDEDHGLRRCAWKRGISELQDESRTDVSWITEEAPDRVGDIVLATGMDDSHFQLNPIVTLNHRYDQPPVGRSLWRKRSREGALHGIKAKTLYPARPARWTLGDWPPDVAFELVKAGLLQGKSIGFIPLKMRAPTAEEIARHGPGVKVRNVIERWLLAEYACCYLPMQPNSVVREIAKSVPAAWREMLQLPKEILVDAPPPLKFTTETELTQLTTRLAASASLEEILEKTVQRSWQKVRGLV